MNVENIPVLTGEACIMVVYNIVHSPMLYMLLGFIALDFASGSAKAMITGQFSSKVGINGIIKHLLVLVLVIFLKFFGRLFGLHALVLTMGAAFSFNYFISIIENLESMGIEFPPWVQNRLKQMKKKAENEFTIDKYDKIVVKKNEGKKGTDR